jgi:plasmid stabilization system protein ParE
MTPWKLSDEAIDDIGEICDYIARDNPAAADQLESDIFSACEELSRHPLLGHRRSDLTDEPVRFWLVRRHYLIVYHPGAEMLVIARVIHASRDVGSQL